ncbi:RHS repeat-associated core domain-containing protein [Streptomyces sedi]|uniref:RHS repeat-associated core domain-containing protein n=2 Tax=Streptomyces sedi TaxID=555059 RepID=UPI001476B241|nr:RHS repeat-associated core domain-containing protein [Streptomyces sedi]
MGHQTHRAHDRYDRLRSLTDPLGRTTSYEYDASGHLNALVEPDGTRHAQENNDLGRPVSVTQPDGGVWRMTYDERGNLTSETDPAGGRIAYTFDATGAVVTITDAAGRSAHLTNDATGMPVAATDAEGAVTRLERDAFGRVTTRVAPDGRVDRSRWTVEGLLTERVHPDGGTERRGYDGEGNLLEHLAPNGAATRFTYYGLDLLSSRINPDGTRLGFAYDSELRVTEVTNGSGATWSYAYDPVGRLTHETDFGGRTQTYRHDAAGQLMERVNAAGQTIRYSRDHRGKILEQHAPEGRTTFAYDPMGQVRHVHAPGVELDYERDPLGRILAETCNGATVRSEYDTRGRRVRRVTPSGHQSHWEYDDRDQPTSVASAGRRMTFAHDDNGHEVERRVGASRVSQTWNDAGQLASQTLHSERGPAARSLQHRAYTYRADGPVNAITDRLGGDRSIDLDDRGRITGVRAEGWTERYVYDAAGDLADAELVGAGNEGRRSRSDISYQHDAQGRVVVRRRKRLSRKADVWHYTWDSQDRLVAVTTPDGTRWTYLYDPFGRRVAKRRMAADGQTVESETRFHWDRFTPAEQTETTPDGDIHRTVWDWEQDRFTPVTQIESVAPGDRPQEWVDERFYSIVADLVGTPTELVDETGEIAWHHQATVWGAPRTEPDAQRAHCPLRFPGQYADPESGLHYNYQRHYDPDTGQYATLDPLGLAPGPNPRGYVANPMHEVDPFGLAPDCERALAAARDRANLERARPGANKFNRPTSSAGLTVTDAAGNQHTFTGASIKGGGDHNLHPDVQAAYDRVPQDVREALQGNQHGRCGEAEALTNALNAGVDPRGGTMAAVEVRAANNPKHGVPKEICPSCAHVLDQFGITGVT